ncbi:hypothetical protein G9A89_015751 [Geosiphon pyriformis]|nr:hypothetical protein G9A89_015751 [Geosiphon pyriformis]
MIRKTQANTQLNQQRQPQTMNSENYNNLKQYLETLTIATDWSSDEKHQLQQKTKQYFLHNNTIYYQNFRNSDKPLRLIQENEKETILYNMYSNPLSAHLGKNSTTQRTLEHYFWPQMRRDIHKYVKSYENCQRKRETRPTKPLNLIKVGQPFD